MFISEENKSSSLLARIYKIHPKTELVYSLIFKFFISLLPLYRLVEFSVKSYASMDTSKIRIKKL